MYIKYAIRVCQQDVPWPFVQTAMPTSNPAKYFEAILPTQFTAEAICDL